jgi:3-isopropylmalate/(R)-2-methylmalate dehydratase small subunit
MEKFTILSGAAVPMFRADIDTGAMSPTGKNNNAKTDPKILFCEARFEGDGKTEKADFILNQPRYRESKIIIAGKNFGCGSSRESAVWALNSFGIRCAIAPSFGPIFWENCFQNSFLPIQLPDDKVEAIAKLVESAADPTMTVNLETCEITLPDGSIETFSLIAERRTALLEGLDELGELLHSAGDCDAFEAKDRDIRPWFYNGRFATA